MSQELIELIQDRRYLLDPLPLPFFGVVALKLCQDVWVGHSGQNPAHESFVLQEAFYVYEGRVLYALQDGIAGPAQNVLGGEHKAGPEDFDEGIYHCRYLLIV